jgi:hypothetical protein
LRDEERGMFVVVAAAPAPKMMPKMSIVYIFVCIWREST